MQTVSSSLLTSLRAAKTVRREYSMVVEFYSSDAEPGADGFDPSGADLVLALSKTGGDSEPITFMGVEYKRLVASIGDIKRTLRKEISGLSIFGGLNG